MAGSRTLKLSILADVDNLKKGLTDGTKDVETFGDQITKVGKMAAAAFVAAAAAAGAYAVKIGIDGVKAALEDEKAQRILAQTLENTTGATNAQIAAVEDYITKTALAVGVTDDQLRPALSRLVRSTKDTEEAQKLLNLALDISSATGKPLELIANSLGKAYDGNTNALGKLGLGIDQSILKTKDFNKVYESLRTSFAGFAANEANTFQGRLDRMKVAFDEAKESIGFALLPVLEQLMKFVNNIATPIIDSLNKGLSDKSGLAYYFNNVAAILKNIFLPIWDGLVYAFDRIKNAIADNAEGFLKFGKLIADYVAPVLGSVLGSALKTLGDIAGGVLTIIGKVAGFIADVVETAIKGVNMLIQAYNKIPLLPNIPTIPVSSAPSVTVPKISTSVSTPSVTVPKIPTPTSGGTGGSSGVSSAVSSASSAAAAATIYVPTVTIGGAPAGYVPQGTTIAPTINIGVAGDPEGVARTVVDVLNRSYGRGALGAEALLL